MFSQRTTRPTSTSEISRCMMGSRLVFKSAGGTSGRRCRKSWDEIVSRNETALKTVAWGNATWFVRCWSQAVCNDWDETENKRNAVTCLNQIGQWSHVPNQTKATQCVTFTPSMRVNAFKILCSLKVPVRVFIPARWFMHSYHEHCVQLKRHKGAEGKQIAVGDIVLKELQLCAGLWCCTFFKSPW